MKYIQELTQELGIEAYVLHGWEKDGWLGDDPVIKDPNNNYSRLYSDYQLERIYFLHSLLKKQKEQGIKRTNKKQIESLLFENFGGEVVEIEKNEMTVLPTSIESLIELITNQNRKLQDLEEMVRNQPKIELPEPVDYTDQFQEVKNELKFSQEREEKLISLIEELQDKVESLEEKTQNVGKKPKWKFWE